MIEIRLFTDQDSWMMTTTDPIVEELFGAATLPTAFMACMPADDVLRSIQELNPDAIVMLSEEMEAA